MVIIILEFTIVFFSLSVAANVVAALRGQGFHKCSGGLHTSKFPQMFLRAYTPTLAKPLVRGSAFCPSFIVNYSYYYISSFSACIDVFVSLNNFIY
jgi:hypothetical protein